MNWLSFRHEAITPSDSANLPKYSTIVVTVAGDLAMEDRVGTQITYAAVPAYTRIEGFMPLKVLATGTTASGIVGWRLEDGV